MSPYKKFHAELKTLHNALLDYSDQHPEVSTRLNLREYGDKDPSVSRLLEGVAYIGTQIKEQIEQTIPEISQTLLDQIAPDLLKPIVSSVMMRFKIDINKQHRPHHLASGTEMYSAENNNIKFTTTEDLTIHPLEIIRLHPHQTSSKNTLNITFRLPTSIDLKDLDLKRLPIYIHEDYDTALQIYYLLTQNLENIRVQCRGTEIKSKIKLQTSLQKTTQSDLKNILSVIKKHFIFPEQYLFFYLLGLDDLCLPDETEEFELVFSFQQNTVKNIRWRSDIFLLNTVLADNLFQHTAEPFHLETHGYEYPLTLDANQEELLDLWNIQQVSALDTIGNDTKKYRRLQDLNTHDDAYYQLITRKRQANKPQHYLRFTQTPSTSETITVLIQASNHFQARKIIKQGQLNTPSKQLENITCSNINRPSRYVAHDALEKIRMPLVAYLGLQMKTLLSLDSLKLLLTLLDWQASKKTTQIINSILAINNDISHEIIKGAVYPVQAITLEIDDRLFISSGEALLFSEVLYCLYLQATPMNHVLHFQVHGITSGTTFKFRQ
jgi:type VI secretion system protein ImpG